ncbi:MAG TPA: hypothetical protein VNK95_12085, partial [Caldilineaceae bacterium]|nr:hypothetical protein [Caldilineaceae bacterium]
MTRVLHQESPSPMAGQLHPAARRLRIWRGLGRVAVFATLAGGALVMTVPFYWLLSSSLKEPAKIWLFPPQWVPDPVRWQNYTEALTASPFHLYLFNTLVIVVAGEIGVLLTASMAAYGFARLRFPGRD